MLSEKLERLRKLLKGLRKKPENGNSYFGSEARTVMTKGWKSFVGLQITVESETEDKYLFLAGVVPFDAETTRNEKNHRLMSWLLDSDGRTLISVAHQRECENRIDITTEMYFCDIDDLVESEETLDALIANIERQLSMAIARKASEVATFSDVLADDLHSRRH